MNGTGEVVLTDRGGVVEIETAPLERVMDSRPQLGCHVMRSLAVGLGAKLARVTAGRVHGDAVTEAGCAGGTPR